MTAAGSSARATPAGLSIGAVLAKLRPEFPDLSISKIRFLESEDLVTPRRTAAGYRQFSAADIERLRFILTAQRDHYLPLKVIREQLDAVDRGAGALPTRRPRLLVAAEAEEVFAPSQRQRLSRDELKEEADLSEDDLVDAESFGLIEAGPTGYYDADAVLAARTVSELLALGIEPRHLRALRSAADREAALVASVVAAPARKRDPDARERALSDASAHAATLMRLHALLVKASLERDLGAG